MENEEAEKMAGGGSASSSSATKGPKKKKSTAATARKLRVNPSPSGEPGTAQCWEGKSWYQKVIRYGRADWEES